MKTVDLGGKKGASVEDLLELAKTGPLRILAADRRAYVLEDAGDFDKEFELLGKSKKFQRFLKQRSKEPATVSLEEYRRSLS